MDSKNTAGTVTMILLDTMAGGLAMGFLLAAARAVVVHRLWCAAPLAAGAGMMVLLFLHRILQGVLKLFADPPRRHGQPPRDEWSRAGRDVNVMLIIGAALLLALFASLTILK